MALIWKNPDANLSASVARTSPDLDHRNALTLNTLRIRLFNPYSEPIPNALFHLTIGQQEWEDTADGDGWVEVTGMGFPDTCAIEWNHPPDASSVPSPPDASNTPSPSGAINVSLPFLNFNLGTNTTPPAAPGQDDSQEPPPSKYIYSATLQLNYDRGAPEDQAAARLNNLGHTGFSSLEDQIKAFQRHYSRAEGATGTLDDVQADLDNWHDNTCPLAQQVENSWDMFA